MLQPSKPKASRRLSAFLFGSKDKPQQQQSSEAKGKAPETSSSNSSKPKSSAAETAGASNQVHHRHASSSAKSPSPTTSDPSSSNQLATGEQASSSRNVSAPLPKITTDPDLSDSTGFIGAPNDNDSGAKGNNGNDASEATASSDVPKSPAADDGNPGPSGASGTRKNRTPTITMDSSEGSSSSPLPPPSLNLSSSDLAAKNSSRSSLVITPPPTIPAAAEEKRRHSGSSGSLGIPRPHASSVSREERSAKARSWVPGTGVLAAKHEKKKAPPPGDGMRAWVAGTLMPYELTPLCSGETIPELWDDMGDTLVYLFPQDSGHGPSFRVDSVVFAASPSLTFLARGSEATDDNQANEDARSDTSRHTRDEVPDDTPQQELHLYLPVPLIGGLPSSGPVKNDEDVDMLVLFRNLFSFLVGHSLIATPRFPSIFEIFMEIAGLLNRFEFSNLDGSTLGETVTSSFGSYCEELAVNDVRNNPEKMAQAVVIGERMRHFPLYQEGFTHAVGCYLDVKDLKEFKLMSTTTQQRIERAYMDLEHRVQRTSEPLNDFDFPSLYSGFVNSTMNNEAGLVRYKNWKSATFAMRKHVMHYLKQLYGSWPPKPKNKHLPPLNRKVTQQLYNDMCDLYNIFVDRTNLTDRSIDMQTALNDESADIHEATAKAIRQVMSEFDRSNIPVKPPIPFDVPRIPSLDGVKTSKHKQLTAKQEAKENAKKLSTGEINEILFASYNTSSMKSTPFLKSFLEFERKQVHGKSVNELADYRCGQWLFMYVVLQSLPMVVVDAPDVQFTEGVDYFLCVPPRGGAPWAKDDPKAGRSWFGVAGGTGVVSLPSDIVAHGVEGVFRRSHCWQVATKWAEEAGLNKPEEPEPEEEPEEEEAPPEPSAYGQYPQGYMYPPPPPMGMEQQGYPAYPGYPGYPGYPPQGYYQPPPPPPANYRQSYVPYPQAPSSSYQPLPSQQFSTTQSGQYLPYGYQASQPGAPPAAGGTGTPSTGSGKPESSSGSVSGYGQQQQQQQQQQNQQAAPQPSHPSPEQPQAQQQATLPFRGSQVIAKPNESSTNSITSSSSNTTGSGSGQHSHNNASSSGKSASGIPLPPLLMPANGSSTALSHAGTSNSGSSPMPSENQIPPMQYPQYPQMGPMPMPPQPPYINHGASGSGSSLGGSRPQSPTLGSAVGTPGPGAPAYGVTPRLRPPRQSSGQRASTGASRSSIYAGIEQLPLPQGVVPMDPAPSRISTYNPNASFDTILKEHPGGKKKKKWSVGGSG